MKTKQDYLDRYYNKMVELREYLGGVCVECGATENLEFDHIDPNTKTHTIGGRSVNMSFDKIKPELDKCQLLCKSCHKNKTREERGWKKMGTHGTLNSYTKMKCRCAACRKVWNEASLRWKKKYRAN